MTILPSTLLARIKLYPWKEGECADQPVSYACLHVSEAWEGGILNRTTEVRERWVVGSVESESV